MKNKKILIVIAIVCLALALGALSAALIIKKNTVSGQKTTTVSVSSATGEEYVAKENREDYKKISSYGIKGEPDSKVKAYFYNKAKSEFDSFTLYNFDLIKTYDSFRIYDLSTDASGYGKQNHLFAVYINGESAVIMYFDEYDSSEERADMLTDIIKKLDSDYEKLAAEAKAMPDENKLY